MRHVALLRGVNVGGNRKVPMADLAAVFRAAGCADVTTYIASGNVLFSSDAPPVADLEAAIAARFGFDVPLVVRDQAAWGRTIAANPLDVTEPKRFHVYLLKARPTAAAVAKLDPARSPNEPFRVVGDAIYVQYADVAHSKLTAAWFDKALGTVATARNWLTMQAIAERL